MKYSLPVIALAALIGFVYFLPVTGTTQSSGEEPPKGTTSALLDAELEGLPAGEVQRHSQRWAINFVDVLDNLLVVPFKAVAVEVDGELLSEVDSTSIQGFVAAGRSLSWVVTVPFGDLAVTKRTDFDESETAIEGQFAVHYRPSAWIAAYNAYGKDVTGEVEIAYCILNPAKLAEARAIAEDPLMETLWPSSSVGRLLEAYSTIDSELQTYTLPQITSSTPTPLMEAGILVLWASSPQMGSDWIEVPAAPGEALSVELWMRRRPKIVGQVFDENGSPLSNAPISLIVSYGETQNPDMGEGDFGAGMAAGAGGRRGHLKRVGRLDRKTNSEGKYSVVVPRGEFYGVEVSTPHSYGFSSTTELDTGYMDRVELDVYLSSSLPPEGSSGAVVDEGYYIRVVDDAGEPVGGVGVRLLITDDFTWMRQLPICITNSDGFVIYPWVSPGTIVKPVVYSNPDSIASNICKEPSMALPSSSLKLVVPKEALIYSVF